MSHRYPATSWPGSRLRTGLVALAVAALALPGASPACGGRHAPGRRAGRERRLPDHPVEGQRACVEPPPTPLPSSDTVVGDDTCGLSGPGVVIGGPPSG